MNLLADTHVVLWWLADDPKLSRVHRALIADAGNTIAVSAVTIAEVSIKASLGKLAAPELTEQFLETQGFTVLPLDARHAAAMRDLPWHHRDPFDRMLIAQCTVEQLPLITDDARIRDYAIETR